MVRFEELEFEDTKQGVCVRLYNIFEVIIPHSELLRLGEFEAKGNSISFKGLDDSETRKKFLFLLNTRMPELVNKITNNPATFIHEGTGIPLLGNISFGIVDRGSSLLEIKPVTSCMLNCIYCSLSEGLNSRMHDFVVQRDYLIEGIRRLVEFKGISIETHINCHGEPLLYAKLDELINGIKGIKGVNTISMNTNGVMLSKQRIDELIDAGLSRFNISFNACDKQIATKMAGSPYPVEHIIKMMEYITSRNMPLVIAPVIVPGFNEDEVPDIIRLGKRIGAKICIQNFLEYRHGRKPAKQWQWKEFYDRLKTWEKELDIKLKLSALDFNIIPTKTPEKPFKMGDVLKASIICPGRYKNEAIVAAKDRSITVITNKTRGRVKFKIVRTKHNIFIGKEL